jgi:drug/metabolite transporter (DMT)-like permease
VKALWMVAGLLGMTAGTLTWTIGFRVATVSYAASVPTTTLALMMGFGGYLMTERRHRRWSWILVVLSLALGPFVRGAWQYFLEGPIELGLLCLMCAGVAALTGSPRRPPEPRSTDGDQPE